MHVESLRTMGKEGLLQIAGQFHMGQLKKMTVKPFSAKTRTFLSKRNFDRHKIWKSSLMLCRKSPPQKHLI
jgi:hypothetical protein